MGIPLLEQDQIIDGGRGIGSTEIREGTLIGQIALVTGSSRDIGASIAIELARNGAYVIGNYLNKEKRARSVTASIREFGGNIEFVGADITSTTGREKLLSSLFQVSIGQPRLDTLVLNASGPTKAINVVAANRLVDMFLPVMSKGGSVILMQSVPGHFYEQIDNPAASLKSYNDVAIAKNAGEKALRARMFEFDQKGVRFYVVCAPLVEDTSNLILFTRRYPDFPDIHHMLTDRLNLPTIVTKDQVAEKVLDLIIGIQPSGYTEYFRNLNAAQ